MRRNVVLTILTILALFGSQPAFARDRDFFPRSEQSSKNDRSYLKQLFNKRHPDRARDVIPAPNGNTGINGSGLPKSTKKGKGKLRPGRVIPAPNGNTGINGSGLPR